MARYMKILQIFLILVFVQHIHAQTESEGLLTLHDCINIALNNNSTLKTIKYAEESAGMDVLSSYSGILPNVTVSAGRSEVVTGPAEYLSNEPVGFDSTTGNVIYELRTRSTSKSTRQSTVASLDINQNIFDGGNWWNQIRKANADKRSAEFNLASQKDNTILQVEQAYFNLLAQIKLLEVNELAVGRSQKQLDRAEKMYELGATAKLDVFRARVNLGNDRIAFMNQKNLLSQSEKDLNLVMGRDPFEPLDVEIEVNLDKSLPNVDEMIETAFENQPLLKKNEQDVKSSDLSVSLASGVIYPRLYAYMSYNRFHEKEKKVFSDFDQNYQTQFGVRLSLNIFNGFNDYTGVQKARIGRRNAQENFEEYKRNLKSAIHNYYEDYQTTMDKIEIYKDNLEAAQEEHRLAEERYQVGAGTSLDVREAQVNLTRAEQMLVAEQFSARIIAAQLDNQLGLSYAVFQESNK